MANNVRCSVQFVNIDEAGKEKLESLYNRIRKDENPRWFGDLWVAPGGDITYEETNSRSWYTDNIGAKWCYFDDFGDDYFVTESAWDWPSDGVEWVVTQVAKAQPNIVAEVRYEDEMPNFYGAAVYNADGLYEDFQTDYDEMRLGIMDENEDIAAEWNDEEEEFSEEGYDLFNDVMYDYINDRQDDFFVDITKEVLEIANQDDK